jgi:hypothetical protein
MPAGSTPAFACPVLDQSPEHCACVTTIALTRETWAKLYLSEAIVQQLVASGEAKFIGDTVACDRVLDLFDKLDQVKNTLVPRIQPLGQKRRLLGAVSVPSNRSARPR